MIKYFKKTWKNKLAAVALVAVGIAPICLDNDATFFALALMLAIPLFLAKENYIA